MNTSILLIIYGLIYIPFFVVGFIVMILTIKLMRRGIVALDKYLEENQ
jgi:hypothetical protein